MRRTEKEGRRVRKVAPATLFGSGKVEELAETLREAADLIRFQQAYQAAAKAMQISSQLFDSIIQVR